MNRPAGLALGSRRAGMRAQRDDWGVSDTNRWLPRQGSISGHVACVRLLRAIVELRAQMTLRSNLR